MFGCDCGHNHDNHVVLEYVMSIYFVWKGVRFLPLAANSVVQQGMLNEQRGINARLQREWNDTLWRLLGIVKKRYK